MRLGLVSNDVIGINVQVEDYEYWRLMDEVYYLDNERNLDAFDLPVPDAGDFFSLW